MELSVGVVSVPRTKNITKMADELNSVVWETDKGAADEQAEPHLPPVDVQDDHACYAWLMTILQPAGLACPGCGARDGLGVHRRHRAPVLDYRCGGCGRVFNAWTGTVLQGTHRRPSHLVRILQGIVRGTSTAQLARELACSRRQLLELRHRLEHFTRNRQEKAEEKGGAA